MLAVHRWPNVGPTLFTQRQHYANGTIVGPTLGQRRLAIWVANTSGGVKRSGLGAHAVGLLVVY